MSTYTYFNICICIHVNTIDDMQNEMDFYDHCNEFEYNHDFLKFVGKIDDAKEMHLI